MKNGLLRRVAAVLGGLCCAGSVLAHDGTINVTGAIMVNTCVVSADSTALTLKMGTVSKRQFSQVGGGSAYQQFTIHLEGCGNAARQVSVTFTGTADATNPQLLAIDSNADSTQGIAIALYDRNKVFIPLNDASQKSPLEANQLSVTLPFYARFLANGGEVHSGIAQSAATFSLSYD
jgi:type 1 fimbria pilin